MSEYLKPNEKKYIWTPEMDYETFCRANNLDKYLDSHLETFLLFEEQYIEAVSEIEEEDL